MHSLSRWWCCPHGLRLKEFPPETVYTTHPSPTTSAEQYGTRQTLSRDGAAVHTALALFHHRMPICTLPALPALRDASLVSRVREITYHSLIEMLTCARK